jgi:L,D-transpeptidase YcbB
MWRSGSNERNGARAHAQWRLALLAILVGLLCAGARTANSSPIRTAIAGAVAEAELSGCPQAPPHAAARAAARAARRAERGCPRSGDTHGLRDALRTAYVRSGGNPLWIDRTGPTPQALALLTRLRAADAYGLRPEDYASAALAGVADRVPIDGFAGDDRTVSWARSDVALSAAALRFVSDLHFGRVDPRQAGYQLDTPRRPFDLAGAVARLASADDVGRVLASIEPQFYHYKLLEAALPRYRELSERPELTQLPPLPVRPVKPGYAYAGAPALRRLLAAVGDLPAEESMHAAPDLRIDAPLAAAIAKFQARHGLTPDGVLGKATYTALTTPIAHRVRQIELTLERWRWLPAFDSPPIIVNIPQFRLFAFRSTADRKASILQMDVIVGKSYPRYQTPVFAADMKYVVFRPYWDIPYSIMRREMLAEIRANPAYLSKQHLEIVAGQTDAARPLPVTAANIEALAAGKLRLRQQPGADNALGLIKFMFPNHHNVYLHSTPAHQLFKESRRAFSHGCIRVSDPVALAEHVLRNASSDWTRDKILAAMNGSVTQRVSLVKPIRVMILYGTVLATESGDVLFFDDIYGGDKKLEALLGLPPET